MAKEKKAIDASREVRISENALQNIDEITGYIAFVKQEPLSAIKVGDAFFNLFEKIGDNPFVFKECQPLPTKSKIYRQAVCYSWIVVYKITAIEIIILGIIHGARKPSKLRKLRNIK